MLKFDEYIKQFNEGLIKTHDINKTIQSLKTIFNKLNIDYDIIKTSIFSYNIEIFNVNKLTNNNLKEIVDINNNLFGYYPSYIYIVNNIGQTHSYKYDKKYLKNTYQTIKIIFEAKFEKDLYNKEQNNLNIVYHLTLQKLKHKILKNGLIPKSNNRKTVHPDRIYFFKNINNYVNLLSNLKNNDIMNKLKTEQYMLLEISLTPDITTHIDSNYIDGLFTYDNINPNNIKILKEHI